MNEQLITGSEKKQKGRLIAYWIITALVAWELGFGATWDFNLVNQGYVHNIFARLGYPDYLGYILGTGKALAFIAVLVPGFGRLKEWAYAGTFFNFAGALFSHLLARDQLVSVIAPIIFSSLTMASWWLRPASRKLASSTSQDKV
jgi:DoxX-like protein